MYIGTGQKLLLSQKKKYKYKYQMSIVSFTKAYTSHGFDVVKCVSYSDFFSVGYMYRFRPNIGLHRKL